MRGAVGLQMRDDPRVSATIVAAMFKSIWVDAQEHERSRDRGARSLQAAGFDAQAMLALTQDAAVKEALKTVTQEAVERGVFGAPTFFVGNHDVLGPGPAGLCA